MELLDELKSNISQELAMCSPGETPFVCANTSTEYGKKKITDMIIKKVIEQKFSISEAIVQVETDLNPNSYIN